MTRFAVSLVVCCAVTGAGCLALLVIDACERCFR